jgi:hypothetical protein
VGVGADASPVIAVPSEKRDESLPPHRSRLRKHQHSILPGLVAGRRLVNTTD